MLRLDHLQLLDHHGHPWLRDWQQQDAAAFRACFSESPSAALVESHLSQSLPYRRALKQLATLLDCAPTEEAILAVRRTTPAAAYLSRLFAGAHFESFYLDDGFPPRGVALSVAEMAAATGLSARRVVRVETVVEELTVAAHSFTDLVERFDALVGELPASGAVALKSIAAYRSGLRLAPVATDEASRAWAPLRAIAQRDGALRLSAKPVVDFFTLRALGCAARQGAALQLHTGYGDPDLDLREANPLHLRAVLEDPAYRDAAIVLLHGAYPYTREAAYLAAVYPHVYLDVSTALPPLGTAEMEAILRQALSVAPASKLLLSTDAARIPEHHALGALMARSALAAVLQQAIDNGDLDQAEAEAMATWPLHRTARAIYGNLDHPSAHNR